MADEDYGEGALDAVNEALATIGHDAAVEELSRSSTDPVARKAATLYHLSRRKVLRDHAWGFARRVQPVHSVCRGGHAGGAPSLPYEAPLPADALRFVAFYAADGTRPEAVVQGETVRSAAPLASVVYIEDARDLTAWSRGAYAALVLRLAADLAKPVTGRINERQLQEQAYSAEIANAKVQDANGESVSEMAWGRSHYADAMRGGVPGIDARPDGWRR